MESSECGAVLVTRCYLIIFALIAAVPLTSYMELLRLRDVVTPPKSHSQYVIELFMDDRHWINDWINEHTSDGSWSSSSSQSHDSTACIPARWNTGICYLNGIITCLLLEFWSCGKKQKGLLIAASSLWICKSHAHVAGHTSGFLSGNVHLKIKLPKAESPTCSAGKTLAMDFVALGADTSSSAFVIRCWPSPAMLTWPPSHCRVWHS